MFINLKKIFQDQCLLCRKDTSIICHSCLQNLKLNDQIHKIHANSYLDELIILFKAHNDLEFLIKKLKYKGMKEVANFLVDRSISSLQHKKFQNYILTYVPQHWKKTNWRGFNHAEILAIGLGERLQIAVENTLVKTRNTFSQSTLDLDKRNQSPICAYAIRKNIHIPQKICLVDDIVTSGSTLDYCAKLLKESGAKKVKAIVLTSNRII